jgi:hypothetical protein
MSAAAHFSTLCVPEDATPPSSPSEELYSHTPGYGALTIEEIETGLAGETTYLHTFRGALNALEAIPSGQTIWIIHCFMNSHVSHTYSYPSGTQTTYSAVFIDNYCNSHAVYNYSPAVPWQRGIVGQPLPSFEQWCKSLQKDYPDKYRFPLTDKTIDIIKAMPIRLNMNEISQLWLPRFATYATTHTLAVRTPDALRKEEERRKEAKRRELEAQIAALQETLSALNT